MCVCVIETTRQTSTHHPIELLFPSQLHCALSLLYPSLSLSLTHMRKTFPSSLLLMHISLPLYLSLSLSLSLMCISTFPILVYFWFKADTLII